MEERKAGPLFVSRTGGRLQRQNVDDALKVLANQANAQLAKKDQRIHLSAHVLRHTMLRKVAEKFGVQHAMEAAGHTSSNYVGGTSSHPTKKRKRRWRICSDSGLHPTFL
jgi:integrase